MHSFGGVRGIGCRAYTVLRPARMIVAKDWSNQGSKAHHSSHKDLKGHAKWLCAVVFYGPRKITDSWSMSIERNFAHLTHTAVSDTHEKSRAWHMLQRCHIGQSVTSNSQCILGIETSCDDTGAAVVNEAGQVLGEALHNQHATHLRHGGIIPPIASNLHERNIEEVVNKAMAQAGVTFRDLDAIATTVKPGMPLSLAVGTKYGKHLARTYSKPFIPIHHMEAHALTARMVEEVAFPFLVLLVSGGHSLLAVAHTVERWSIIGQTVDDAPGEALDKSARRLKLRNIPECAAMSGGQAIEHLAVRGDPNTYEFPTPMWKYRDCSFSFAGLKNSLLRLVLKLEQDYEIEGGRVLPRIEDICASFQYSLTKHLVRQTHKAMIYVDVRELIPRENQTLVVSGGVACNQYIRSALHKLCVHLGYRLVCPPPKLCTDNGIMVAWNGMERWRARAGVLYAEEEIEAVSFQHRCPLGKDLTEDVRSLGITSPKWVKF